MSSSDYETVESLKIVVMNKNIYNRVFNYNFVYIFNYQTLNSTIINLYINFIKYQKMVKAQAQQEDKQKHKSHKTLRDKLKKRRVQEKAHLKQKKEKRKLFNSEEQKRDFFNKHFSSETQQKYKEAKRSFKYKKINKNIQKFINVYQDDLEDFYQIFKQFDNYGFIDISGLQNLKLQNILKKLFKYLPLTLTSNKNNDEKQIIEYRKKKQYKISLETIIRNLVRQSIQNYIEYGTEDEKQMNRQQSSDDNSENQKQLIKKSHSKRQNKVNINTKVQQDQQGEFALPQNQYPKKQFNNQGPRISEEHRLQIAQLFQKQLQQIQAEKQYKTKKQQDAFDQIFSMGTTINKLKQPIRKHPLNKSLPEELPESLYAEGSAKLGQKVQMKNEEDYEVVYQPIKLIDEHRQIMAINRGRVDLNEGNKKNRKSFDRQRDVVNSRSRLTVQNMEKGVFFNFKDRMSIPKKTNNLL